MFSQYLGNFVCFCRLLIFFLLNSTLKVGPDQDVGPDLGPNCLQRLSADDTSRQIVNLSNLYCETLLNTLRSFDSHKCM